MSNTNTERAEALRLWPKFAGEFGVSSEAFVAIWQAARASSAPAAPADVQQCGPSDAQLDAAWASFDWEGWVDPSAARRSFIRTVVLARYSAAPTNAEMMHWAHKAGFKLTLTDDSAPAPTAPVQQEGDSS